MRSSCCISKSLPLHTQLPAHKQKQLPPRLGLHGHYESSGPTRWNSSLIYFSLYHDLQRHFKNPPRARSSLLQRMFGKTPKLPQIPKEQKNIMSWSDSDPQEVYFKAARTTGKPWFRKDIPIHTYLCIRSYFDLNIEAVFTAWAPTSLLPIPSHGEHLSHRRTKLPEEKPKQINPHPLPRPEITQ